MPTIRGWLSLIFGAFTIVAGRLFGLNELYIVGSALLAVALVAIAVAVMRPLRLAVARTVTPSRLHVGSVGRVELAIRNGQSKTPVMRLTDRVQGTSGAQLLVSPLKGDEVARAAYRLPTERRGVVTVGPADFEAIDPFGLASRRFSATSIGQLVVYPEIVPLPPAPPSPATERRSMSDTPEFLGGRSEEFHALRNYVPGDDIRRINWGASARHDDLIVREDEAPTQNHLTVLFDNASLKSERSVDRAASVAGSILASMQKRPDPFRLLTSDGRDTGFVMGMAGVEKALSILAIVEGVDGNSGGVVPRDAQGAVVVVSGPRPTIGRAELGAYGRVMSIAIDPAAWDSSQAPVQSTARAVPGEIQIRLGRLEDLASVWTSAIATLLSSSGKR